MTRSPIDGAIERALDEVLARPEYDWRIRPESGLETESSLAAELWRSFTRSIAAFADAIADFLLWIRRLFGSDSPAGDGIPGASFALDPRVAWALFGVAVLALAIGIGLAVRRARRRRARADAVAPAAAVEPQVGLDESAADRFESDEWLRLAGELERAGDFRAAARAVHLAALSRLARGGLLRLAAAKTNRDYERELARRARSRPELGAAFTGNVHSIEPVWYGDHPADARLVGELRARFALMTREMAELAPAA